MITKLDIFKIILHNSWIKTLNMSIMLNKSNMLDKSKMLNKSMMLN
jgi:hypothetical protein